MKRSILRLIYRRVLRGLPGLGTPSETASRVRRQGTTLDDAASRIVAIHTTLGSSQGFLFGLPGLLLLPVTLPANLAAAAAVQLHMAASLAALAGLDPDDAEVRDRCVACLLRRGPGDGSSDEGEEIATRTGVKLLERGARWVVERVARRAARSTLRRVGVRSVPLIGGMLGGASDGWVTRAVGACARAEFVPTVGRHPSPDTAL